LLEALRAQKIESRGYSRGEPLLEKWHQLRRDLD
jgi:hypothetical protein